jgi:hypothetical protein
MIREIARALGAADGGAPDYYRDYTAAMFGGPAVLIAGGLWSAGRFTTTFWVVAAVATLCLLAARKKQVILLAALGVVAVRCAFVFATSLDPLYLLLGIGCAVVWVLVAWRGAGHEYK